MKSRLRITRCSVDSSSGTVTPQKDKVFVAMVNPTTYSLDDKVQLKNERPIRGGVLPGRIKLREPTKVTLGELVLDGTGILTDGEDVSVKGLIGQLYEVAFAKDKAKKDDEAPVVRLQWGDVLGDYQVNHINVKYTLFKPDGTPLRANVTLELTVFKLPEIVAQAVAFGAVDPFVKARSQQLTSFRKS
jgi:hypothetical protein